MTSTSDERREVAELLRIEVMDEDESLDYPVCRIVNDVLGVNGAFGAKAARILADLIDPTCHMTDSMWDNGECTWGCICSACGARIEHEYASDIYYCPRCGARVVSD